MRNFYTFLRPLIFLFCFAVAPFFSAQSQSAYFDLLLVKPVAENIFTQPTSPSATSAPRTMTWKDIKETYKALRKQIKANRKNGANNFEESVEDKRLYNLSLLAGIFGMGGFLLIFIPYIGFIGFLAAIAGLVLGIVALGKHKKQPEARGKTLALLGVIFGGLTVALALLAIVIIASIWV